MSNVQGGTVEVEVTADASGFDREVDQKVRQSLRGVETAAAKAGTRAGQKLGRGIGVAAKAGAAAAGLAAGALVAASFGNALENSRAQGKVTAQLGLDPAEAKTLARTTGAVYAANFGESLGQVNDAARAVIQNLDQTVGSADLRPLTEQVLSLSQAFDQDLNGVTAAAGNLVRNGLARDGKEALDVLAAGFQGPANKADDLLDTFNEYGPQFRKLGLDGKTAVGLLAQGLQAGARDADTVADAFKEFSIRAIDGSSTSAAGYKLLGLSAKDTAAAIAKGGPTAQRATQQVLTALNGISDPIKRNTAGVDLFGTKFEDLGPTVVASLDPAKASLEDTAGAAQGVSDALGGGGAAALDAYKRALEASLTNYLGNTVIPVLVSFSGFIQRNGEVIGPVVAALASMAATALLVSKAIAITNVVLEALGVATTVALGPVGLIIIAVAGLAAGLVYAYKTSETFRNAVLTVFRVAGQSALRFASLYLLVFQKIAEAAGHLPGPLGAPFRSAAKAIKGTREKLQGFSHDLDTLGQKKVNVQVGAEVNTASVNSAVREVVSQVKAAGGSTYAQAEAAGRARKQFRGATGGIVRRPTYALIGEAGPEAVVPLNRAPGASPLPGGSLGGVKVEQNFYVTDRQDPDALQRQAAFRFRLAAGA